jgi:glycosyltransferase involved in cell wall biosynthesis
VTPIVSASGVVAGWPGRTAGLLDFYRHRYADDLVTLSLFIPVLNEESGIVGTIEKIADAARQVGIGYEIVGFDDASSDRTAERIIAFQGERPEVPVTLVRHAQRRGVARNYVDGAFLARGTYYRFCSGDDVEPTENFVKIFSAVGRADVIVPYHVESVGRGVTRRFLSTLFARLVAGISGHRVRYFNGGPVFVRAHVLRFHVESTGFGYQAELLTRVLDEGATFEEVGVVAFERAHGTSKALTAYNFLSAGHSLFKLLARRARRSLFG